MSLNFETLTGFTYRGLAPHKFTPMPGVHQSLKPTAGTFGGFHQNQWCGGLALRYRLKKGLEMEEIIASIQDTFEQSAIISFKKYISHNHDIKKIHDI